MIDTGADMDPITARAEIPVRRAGRNRVEQGRRLARVRPRPVPQRASRSRGARALCRPDRSAALGHARSARTAGRPQSEQVPPVRHRRAAQRGRAPDAVRRGCAGPGATGTPVSPGPRRARQRHPPGARSRARIPDAQDRAGRARARAGWSPTGSHARASPSSPPRSTTFPASFEQIAATQSNVGRLRAAGVKVAIGMINDNDTHNLFMERQYAGNLVGLQKVPGATGVSWGEALAMITSRPAEAIGMGGEIGSLAAGPARRLRDLVRRSAGRNERCRAGLYRRRPPAVRDPPDAAVRALSRPQRSALAACLSALSFRHSRETGNPAVRRASGTPAFAGVTERVDVSHDAQILRHRRNPRAPRTPSR